MGYLSIEGDVMPHLRIASSSVAVDDGVLLSTVLAAEGVVAQRCGPLVPTSVTSVVSGGPVLALPRMPLISVESATGDGGTVTTGFTVTDPRGGLAKNLALSARTWSVTYTAGWATVPDDLRLGVLELVRHLWRPQLGSMARQVEEAGPGYLIPNRVTELLAPYTMPGFA